MPKATKRFARSQLGVNSKVAQKALQEAKKSKKQVRVVRRQIRSVRALAKKFRKLHVNTQRRGGKMSSVVTKLAEPFSGHNQNGVNWMRRYLNPCDDTTLTITGIPDAEVAPNLVVNMPYTVSYDPAIASHEAVTYSIDSSGRATKVSVQIVRSVYKGTMFYLFPNIFNPLLIVEYGDFKCYWKDSHGTTIRTDDVNYFAELHYSNAFNNTHSFDPTGSVEDVDPETYPSANEIQYYRNMGLGITITNTSANLKKAGQFYCRYFNLETAVTDVSGDAPNDHATFVVGGAPVVAPDFGSGIESKILKGDAGVYGVIYNWHPEYKYQTLKETMLMNTNCRVGDRIYDGSCNQILITSHTINESYPTDVPDDNRNIRLTTAYLEQGMFNGFLKLNDDSGLGANIALQYFANDSWSWKCLGIRYSGAADGLIANIKIAGIASMMCSPASQVVPMIVSPPPYDRAVMEFIALFCHENVMIYPASFNSWNKIWKRIREFYRNNKNWINPAISGIASAIFA